MATNYVYASFAISGSGGGVAVTPPGDASPTTYITGAGMSIHPNGLVAMLPNLSKTYVANPEDNSVSVVNNSTNTAYTGTGYPIAVGSGPIGIAASPDGRYILVANLNGPSISVINPATDTVISTITAANGLPDSPAYIAVTPDSKTAYVTHQISPSAISAIDLTGSSPSLKSGAGYPIETDLSAGLEYIAITPDGYIAYVAANPFDGAVDVIDLTVNPPVVKTGLNYPISLSSGIVAIAVRPDGKEAWGANGGSTLYAIDTSDDTLIETFGAGDENTGNIAFNADSSLAYISSGSGIISVIDTTNYTLSSTITFTTGYAPSAIAIAQTIPPLSSTVFLCGNWFG